MSSIRKRSTRMMIAALACTAVLLGGMSCSSSDNSASSSTGDTAQANSNASSEKSGGTETSDDKIPSSWPSELKLPDGFTMSYKDVDDSTGRIELSGTSPGTPADVFAAWQQTVKEAGCTRTKGNADDATGEDEDTQFWEDSACDGYSVIADVYADGDGTSFTGIYNKD